LWLRKFKIEIYFDSKDLSGSDEKRMGRVIIEEFNQDDANDDIDMSIVCEV
jgi:hypothetical protein